MTRNIWLDGLLGLAIGDALGCPVQFRSRDEIKRRGKVTGMEGYGTYNMPPGTWTDDTSMALAALDSIITTGGVDPDDIMKNFVAWEFDGEYTPFGEAFDEGNTCSSAIWNYHAGTDWQNCGRTGEHANGNGALMRILPVILYYLDPVRSDKVSDDAAIEGVHRVSALTHNHTRSKMACGFYYFMAKEIIGRTADVSLKECLQRGIDVAVRFYQDDPAAQEEMRHFERILSLEAFEKIPEKRIKSSGYVIDSLEAAVWCLIRTDSFQACLLDAVNLGDDSDTVGAIAGGLAGLYYGSESIPADWLDVLKDVVYRGETVPLKQFLVR